MKPSTELVIGIDPSSTATGLAALEFSGSRILRCEYDVIYGEGLTWHERLVGLVGGTQKFLSEHRTPKPSLYAIEAFARGFTNNREEMGMAVGAIRYGLATAGVEDDQLVVVTPRDAKKIACPNWPGFCKANWEAAGYTRKFKMSQPDKASVLSGLQRTLGIAVRDDNAADAVCIAIAGYTRMSRYQIRAVR